MLYTCSGAGFNTVQRYCGIVAGCGPLGLGMVAAARLKNPAILIALDLYDWKVKPFYIVTVCDDDDVCVVRCG